jgi:hypothetical protein
MASHSTSVETALPDSLLECLVQGIAARDAGDHHRALLLLKQAASHEPGNFHYTYHYAHALLQAGNLPEAERVCLGAMERFPGPSAFHQLWSHIPTITAEWGAALHRQDLLLERYPVAGKIDLMLPIAFANAVALSTCYRFSEGKDVIEACWPYLLESCYAPAKVLPELLNQAMYGKALALCERIVAKNGSAVVDEVDLGNIRKTIEQAIRNSEWVNASARDVKLLSLGQRCLPYRLSNRYGLNRLAGSSENMTCFDEAGSHGDATAQMLRCDFAEMADRSQFEERMRPLDIPMPRHKSGINFYHDQGRYLIGADGEVFHAALQQRIESFRRLSKDGPRLFVYSLVVPANIDLLIASLASRFVENNVRLLILNLREEPAHYLPHDCVTYLHIPFPPDYDWNWIGHYSSDRGYAFESRIAEAIGEEMARLACVAAP